MKGPPRKKERSHKRGDNRNEIAVKHRKMRGRIKESKDIAEDRARRQMKFS